MTGRFGQTTPNERAAGQDPHGRLVGRTAERAAIDDVIAATRDGLSGTLVLVGDAGMGKTMLLDYAVQSATDARVARVAGIQSESDLGYAALHRLVVPFSEHVARLPEPQRDALHSVFGLAPAFTAERFLVSLAALSLLAEVALEAPLLCVIDDAHWIDRESLDALSFVARRLFADRVALIFAARRTEAPLPFDGLTTLSVDGLDDDAALRLLAQSASTPVDRGVAQRIVAETGGCPLALQELGFGLSAEQLAGARYLPDPLPITGRLETHFTRQVRALPAETQLLLLIAAADPSGDLALLSRAANALDVSVTAMEPAEQQQMITFRPGIEFRHPLIRAAAYGAANARDRRRVHATLATLVDDESQPDRRIWHLAAAATGPDERIAGELADAARDAHDRGRYAAEAALWSRACELTPDPESRLARLVAATQTNIVAGAPQIAWRLLEEARLLVDTSLHQAQVERLQAALQSFTRPNEIPRVLLAAARALEDLDARLARDTYAEALEACLVSCQLTRGTTPQAVARAALDGPPSPDDEPTVADLMLDGFATRFAVGFEAAVPALRGGIRAMAAPDAGTEASGLSRWAVIGTNAAAELWDAAAFRAILERLERTERERGALDALRITVGGLGHAEMWAGNFARADDYHSQATEIARALGGDPRIWEMLKVELYAWQGRAAETRAIVAALTSRRFAATGAGVTTNLALIGSTIIDIAEGQYADALASAWQLYEIDVVPHGNQSLAEIVEAGVRTGDRRAAMAGFDRLSGRARASGTPWALGLLARSAALVDDTADAESHYLAAIAYLADSGVRTELARAHLVYGEWLRRQKRRLDARDALRTAHTMFETMGAAAFAERARAELAATGERSRRRTVETSVDLTPQELQVARLASEGSTNREIAARLYISASTVDYHLRKVYRKLGLGSRTELRHAIS